VLAALSTTDLAIYLGLYASAVSTAVGLLTLYGELFQRISVIPSEGFHVLFSATAGGGALVAKDEETLAIMGATPEDAHPVLTVAIRNRGRFPVQIQTISRAHWVNRDLFHDLIRQVPFEVEPGHTRTITLTLDEDHPYGSESMRRFFAVDGTGRIHPLRERWRQRLENVLYRRLVLWVRRRRRAHRRLDAEEDHQPQRDVRGGG
jgi:hypothetical protein